MNEQTSYAFNGEEIRFINGRYTVGNHYLCLKDDSLLDTQILLIDDEGKLSWEHAINFSCCMSPYRIDVEYEIIYHESFKLSQVVPMVWYEERTLEELEQFLNVKSKYPIKVIQTFRRG